VRKAEEPLPADLLERPAGEAARRIGLLELERAIAARQALARGDDPEALHDLRVALRRLRSHLRAWQAELEPAAGRKSRRRLARLAATTNPARDAEVGADWLGELAGADAPVAERRAAAALAARLAARREEAAGAFASGALDGFEELAGRLRDRLATWRTEVRLDREETAERSWRQAVRAAIDRHAAALREALAAAGELADEERLHRARIEAKRLRYLVEPLRDLLAEARPVLARLRELQDQLGGGRDLAVLATELAADAAATEAARLAAAAGDGKGPRPAASRAGRLALARRIGARRAEMRRDLRAAWLDAGGPSAAELAAALGRLLAALA